MSSHGGLRNRARWAPLASALLAAASLSVVSSASGAECPNEAVRHEQGSVLPDCRAYELVSPPDKNGGDIMPFTPRTRASADGEAVSFASLVPFGDAIGTGVAVEYMALRGSGGWMTHAITPKLGPASLKQSLVDTAYEDVFSANFDRGLLVSSRPVTADPNVKGVANLYRRTDLRAPGAGSYDLLSACSLCLTTKTPLPPVPGVLPAGELLRPWVSGSSPDLEHVVFESREQLTSEAPSQPGSCDITSEHLVPPPSPLGCATRLYEWDKGSVRLVGVRPDGTPAPFSIAGEGASNPEYTPNVVSDGSDGHSRVFFGEPTGPSGETLSQIEPSNIFSQFLFMLFAGDNGAGNVYARIDHSSTIVLNESERETPDASAPASYLDASANGERVFLRTTQALTNDAPADGLYKIYMYDLTKPASAPDNLTLISPPGTDSEGIWGLSKSGNYVYYYDDGGGHLLLWHDGATTDLGATDSLRGEDRTSAPYGGSYLQARTTPDGRHLLFTSHTAAGDHSDHGVCWDNFPCHELYLYSVETNRTVCVSCTPSGLAATSEAEVSGGILHGGARATAYLNRGITDDGSRVFFSTSDPLVPQDTNGKEDAYEYDAVTGKVSLLSSGRDAADSWYLDSSADGRDVFIATREKLVGWDADGSYDLYDLRSGGGFPEPPPPPLGCSGEACRIAGFAPPAYEVPSSTSFAGAGNVKFAPAVTNTVKHINPTSELKRALKVCRKHRRGRRRKCEAAARKRYGTTGGTR